MGVAVLELNVRKAQICAFKHSGFCEKQNRVSEVLRFISLAV